VYIILSTLYTHKPSHFINFNFTHASLHPHISTISHSHLTPTHYINMYSPHPHTSTLHHTHLTPTHYINTLHIHTPHTHTLYQHVPSTSTHLHTCITHTSHPHNTPHSHISTPTPSTLQPPSQKGPPALMAVQQEDRK